MVDKRIFNEFEIDEESIELQVHQALGTNNENDMVGMIDKTVSNFEPGSILKGKIVNYVGDDVIVEVGLKSEGARRNSNRRSHRSFARSRGIR